MQAEKSPPCILPVRIRSLPLVLTLCTTMGEPRSGGRGCRFSQICEEEMILTNQDGAASFSSPSPRTFLTFFKVLPDLYQRLANHRVKKRGFFIKFFNGLNIVSSTASVERAQQNREQAHFTLYQYMRKQEPTQPSIPVFKGMNIDHVDEKPYCIQYRIVRLF